MKKLIVLFSVLFIFLLPVVAQEVGVPEDWMEVITNFNQWFASLGGLAALTVFVAALINKLAKVTGSGWKQIVAIVTAIVISIVGSLVGLGILAEMTVLNAAAVGVGVGLMSNGIFDVALIRGILKALGLLSE